jgi:tetratricopeptide (TPR) repeat protein
MTICTWFQVHYWRNSLTLFQHALDVTKGNYMAHTCIAVSLHEQGRLNETIYHCSEAVRINPNFTRALNYLGLALYEAGRVDEAIPYYKRTLEIDPHFAEANINLALALATKGDFAEAIREYRKPLQTKLDDPNVLNVLGIALGKQDKFDDAIKCFTEALRLVPNSAQAHYYLGQILVQKGSINEAITHFEEAMRLKPDWVEPMNNLAWLLAASKETTIHNPGKAIRLARRACELTNYKKPDLLDTLAVAYAAAGDFNKAIETAAKALELCRSSERNTLKEGIQNRLALYKAGKPYIETK